MAASLANPATPPDGCRLRTVEVFVLLLLVLLLVVVVVEIRVKVKIVGLINMW